MTNRSSNPRVGDIWLIRMKDPDLRGSLVQVEVTEVYRKTVRFDALGSPWAVSSGGYYEIGKDFDFVECLCNGQEVEDELATRRAKR